MVYVTLVPTPNPQALSLRAWASRPARRMSLNGPLESALILSTRCMFTCGILLVPELPKRFISRANLWSSA